MEKIKQKTLLFIVLLMVMAQSGHAQFYNGHQMTFGKSRVQYNDFFWQYYRFPKFDTYFYVSGSRLAEYVSKVANEEIEYVEYSMQEILQRRIIFIIYNKLSEFRQSNIGLVTGNEDYNIGGVTRIVDNKVFIYYEGDHKKLRQQIRASVTEILINEMLYGGSFRDRVSSSAMLNLPEWYTPGLISFWAYNLDTETEAKIKKGILNGKFQKIHRLNGEDAKIAGHAFWRYLSETYGREIISQIVYLTRVSKSVESGFLYVLGIPLKDIMNDWFYYYEGRYNAEVNSRTTLPDDSEKIKKRTKKNRLYKEITMSPKGNYIAYVSNEEGQYKVWLYNTETEKTKKIVKRGNKLEQITDYSYPMLCWHPSGEVLTYIYERHGSLWLDYYTIETKELLTRELFYVDKILDYSFSHDGRQMIMSAVRNGYTDIYVYNVISSTYNRITNDIADDLKPRFIDQSKRFIFSSNRVNTKANENANEEMPTSDFFDLFIYDLNKEENPIIRVTDTYQTNEFEAQEYRPNKYFYLTNKNGIRNLAFTKFDSTISFIDTAIHYRKFTKSYPVSNRSFNIKSYDFNGFDNAFAETFQGPKRYTLFTHPLNTASRPTPDDFQNTWFRTYFEEQLKLDSIRQVEMEQQYEADSIISQEIYDYSKDTLIDIDNYIFEIEKNPNLLENEDEEEGSNAFKMPKQLVYFTNFYSNLLVTQVDFGFMNQSYQTFTGSAFYFNPGFNVLTKVGAIDLFEDYKITGGIRFSADFESNEYLLSVENLKYRLDKNYIFHRQVFENTTETDYSKIFTNEVMAVYKYPLSQIHAFRLTLSARLDEQVYKAFDVTSLNKKNNYKFWGGLKGEYILDNTRKLGLNIYDGTRLKIFGEFYNQIGGETNNNLFVVGGDIRNYLPIHRDFIFASRIAASTSFGKSLLIYYLGGVDNWMNFSRRTPTFDNSTRINQEKNWAYQAVATNMRGFVQNARNGNTFAVANAELRWPIIRYLFNRPISNDFLNNFMVVGFTDVGSAWEGLNPFTANNAYDYENIENPPVTVVIDRKKSPFVAGVGFGLRSRLLGYYIRTDWAWGIDGGRVLPRVFYLSLCTDF